MLPAAATAAAREAVQCIEDTLAIPAVSTAVRTARGMLNHLGLEPIVPGAGTLRA
ncbi:hypothetical protein [Azohydromonas aeria]|uniref:hypothetical protein n=1 Tax=Azohydromonas aeria TaxID=2590212 RepID=UPI001E297DC6|nr:hypothetical protein [Azohydromonas aeria]